MLSPEAGRDEHRRRLPFDIPRMPRARLVDGVFVRAEHHSSLRGVGLFLRVDMMLPWSVDDDDYERVREEPPAHLFRHTHAFRENSLRIL